MRSHLLAALLLAFVAGSGPHLHAKDSSYSFPTEGGWTKTRGGRGGKIVRVTTLAAKGPGSFLEAINTKGPRIIVFEVGGAISLSGHSLTLKEPFVTVAGQTAPAPGITLIRGGFNIATHDVILQHLRVRPGEAGHAKKSGWECDGISMDSAVDVIVDHCSCTWATDENLSASGPRFDGETLADWRANTSHRITFSNNIIAEGLSHSTHGKGEHSKGSLLHDNCTGLMIIGNLYASNVDRSPFAKGGVDALVINNWITNPGRRAIHHALVKSEWKGHRPATARLGIFGNVLEYGTDTEPGLALFFQHGGPLDLFMGDNLAFDRERHPAPMTAGEKVKLQKGLPPMPTGFSPLPAKKVRSFVMSNVGARPWDRDAIDQRIIREANEGVGHTINQESEGGGYPVMKKTRAAFNPDDWDLKTMQRK